MPSNKYLWVWLESSSDACGLYWEEMYLWNRLHEHSRGESERCENELFHNTARTYISTVCNWMSNKICSSKDRLPHTCLWRSHAIQEMCICEERLFVASWQNSRLLFMQKMSLCCQRSCFKLISCSYLYCTWIYRNWVFHLPDTSNCSWHRYVLHFSNLFRDKNVVLSLLSLIHFSIWSHSRGSWKQTFECTYMHTLTFLRPALLYMCTMHCAECAVSRYYYQLYIIYTQMGWQMDM